MPVPSIVELEKAAKEMVLVAQREGNLGSLSPLSIRREVERQFGLDTGTLDVQEYRRPIKSAIAAALDTADEIQEPKAAKIEQELSEMQKDLTSRKKTKPTGKPATNDNEESPAPKQVQKKTSKNYKSAEQIISSDEEDDAKEKSAKVPEASQPVSKHKPLAKKKQKARPSKDANEDQNMPSNKKRKVSSGAEVQGVPDKSDSELSVLIDEPPKRKEKSKSRQTSTKKMDPDKKGKKPSTELTKDEETIKRLKALVVACGVRKVWSKVFQDLNTPSLQIKKLKEILTELGMSGRMSLEQAKAIRAKRELAQELEDVQEFEQSVVGRPSGSSGRVASKSQSLKEESASEAESGSDEEVIPVKRKPTARQSIMAFLSDQSDSH